MSAPGTLDFAGLSFDGTGASTSGWSLGDLTGWYDGPPSKAASEPRPQAHGSFGLGMNWRGARVVSVEGSYVGVTMPDAYAARERLASLQGNGAPSPFTYTEPTLGARTLNSVTVVNGPTIPARLFSPFFAFAFDVLATDPLKYGPAVSVSTGLPVAGTGITYPITYPLGYGTASDAGRVTVTNGGTADTYPMLEVAGGLVAGFSLVELGTGREIRFERLIPAGSTVFLNPRTGRAYIDAPGNDVSGYLTRTDWFVVPAGGSTAIQFAALGGVSGTPVLTARTSPAFW